MYSLAYSGGAEILYINAGAYSETVGAVSFNFTVAQTPALNNGAWRHIAIVYDGTNRKIYTDGTLQNTTAFTTTRSYTTLYIGERSDAPGNTYQGYMQDFRIYKGIAKYTGNFTLPSYSPSTAAGNDSLVDVPTNGAQTDTGVGGQVRGNYCTLNPLESANTLSNGNLDVTSGSASWKISASTIYAQTGKWYCEFTLNAVQGYPQIGVYAAGSTFATSGQMGTSATGYAYNSFNGNKINNSSSTSYGNSWTTGDTIGIAYDLDNGALYFSKNGTWQNSGVPTSGASKTGAAFSLPAGIFYTVAISAYGSDAGSFNFGQRPFAYTAPSGFKALNTANLPTPAVVKSNTVFDTVLWTGNGSSQSITLPGGFSPDLVWLKQRSDNEWNALFNTIVGATTRLFSNSTSAEATNAQTLTAFNSNGFSVGNTAEVNRSSSTYVAWAWDAGSSTVTNNTAGTITPTGVRANATAGFSIVTYTGNRTAGATVGHGLGVAPQMIFIKSRAVSGFGWRVYHLSVGNTKYLQLNGTDAATTFSGDWNNTTPGASVFTLGADGGSGNYPTNDTTTYVAYCFAPVVGYSSFGSWTGNGSADGPFVFTGMRPRYILWKRTDSTSDWTVLDAARDTYNYAEKQLVPNTSGAEQVTGGGFVRIDFLSNGFKLRGSDIYMNANNGTYIYAAFAESPFNYARAR
jgi:hypothetical protein